MRKIVVVNSYLPLCWHATITSGNTKEECVVFGKIIEGEDRVVGFGWRIHFTQDLRREGFGNSRTGLSADFEPRKGTYW